jgi:saccharopine dehydrogenase (NAD+, L-lysine forming)
VLGAALGPGGVEFMPGPPQASWTAGVSPGSRFDSIPSGPPHVLLIGCGAVGSVVARHLAASTAIADLLLADLDGELAKRTAAHVGSPRAHAMQLDAADAAALRRAMRGCGLVINTALPRFNRIIQEAALAEHASYVDPANDSADPFVDSDAWKAAGLTALCAMGEDPGLSNVFARYAADGMDRVESIKVRDGDTASSPEYPFIALFSPETFVEETLAPSRIWRDGTYQAVPPFGEFERYEFPAPIGVLPVYSVDHEEVDTLPRFIGKGVRYVDFKLALDPTTVQTLKRFRDLRLLEPGVAGGPDPRRAFFAALPKPADLAGRVDGYAAVLVEVAGQRDSQDVVHTVYAVLGHREASEKFGATATAYLTGTGVAVGAILLANGTIRERGKVSPETLDPMPFFPLLRKFGIDVRERVRRERSIR